MTRRCCRSSSEDEDAEWYPYSLSSSAKRRKNKVKLLRNCFKRIFNEIMILFMETSHFVERKRDFIAHLKKVLYDGAFTYHLLV